VTIVITKISTQSKKKSTKSTAENCSRYYFSSYISVGQ